jgi:hypothetical protein
VGSVIQFLSSCRQWLGLYLLHRCCRLFWDLEATGDFFALSRTSCIFSSTLQCNYYADHTYFLMLCINAFCRTSFQIAGSCIPTSSELDYSIHLTLRILNLNGRTMIRRCCSSLGGVLLWRAVGWAIKCGIRWTASLMSFYKTNLRIRMSAGRTRRCAQTLSTAHADFGRLTDFGNTISVHDASTRVVSENNTPNNTPE